MPLDPSSSSATRGFCTHSMLAHMCLRRPGSAAMVDGDDQRHRGTGTRASFDPMWAVKQGDGGGRRGTATTTPRPLAGQFPPLPSRCGRHFLQSLRVRASSSPTLALMDDSKRGEPHTPWTLSYPLHQFIRMSGLHSLSFEASPNTLPSAFPRNGPGSPAHM